MTYKRCWLKLVGKVFGRLTVVRCVGVSRTKHLLWACICICGTKATVRGHRLKSGKTKSCGCLGPDVTRVRSLRHGHAVHGATSRTYKSWIAMKSRCTDSNHPHFKRYGGANPPIRICRRWLHSFENFLADMGKRPKGKTLGRFMDSGDYKPSNCSWQTWTRQRQEQKLKLRQKAKVA
jgi:hypothetical protein